VSVALEETATDMREGLLALAVAEPVNLDEAPSSGIY
jgi:hypothetical protein